MQDVMTTRANFGSNMLMAGSAVVFFSFGTKAQIFPSSAFANYNLTSGRFISKFFREDISRNKLKLGYKMRDRRKNGEFKHARFWDVDGDRNWAVFHFNLSVHHHLYIDKYLSSIRDD